MSVHFKTLASCERNCFTTAQMLFPSCTLDLLPSSLTLTTLPSAQHLRAGTRSCGDEQRCGLAWPSVSGMWLWTRLLGCCKQDIMGLGCVDGRAEPLYCLTPPMGSLSVVGLGVDFQGFLILLSSDQQIKGSSVIPSFVDALWGLNSLCRNGHSGAFLWVSGSAESLGCWTQSQSQASLSSSPLGHQAFLPASQSEGSLLEEYHFYMERSPNSSQWARWPFHHSPVFQHPLLPSVFLPVLSQKTLSMPPVAKWQTQKFSVDLGAWGCLPAPGGPGTLRHSWVGAASGTLMASEASHWSSCTHVALFKMIDKPSV